MLSLPVDETAEILDRLAAATWQPQGPADPVGARRCEWVSGELDVGELCRHVILETLLADGRGKRWVAVPEWVMEEIAATCPREDRTAERRVFGGFTADVAKTSWHVPARRPGSSIVTRTT